MRGRADLAPIGARSQKETVPAHARARGETYAPAHKFDATVPRMRGRTKELSRRRDNLPPVPRMRGRAVSGKLELSRRRDNLSWSHHKEVAALEPAEQTAIAWATKTRGRGHANKQGLVCTPHW